MAPARSSRAAASLITLAIATAASTALAESHTKTRNTDVGAVGIIVAIVVVLLGSAPILAFVFHTFAKVTPPPPNVVQDIPIEQPFAWRLQGSGAPELLWLSFRFPQGASSSRWVRRDVGLWGRVRVDGRTVEMSAGALAPGGGQPYVFYAPNRSLGERRATIVVARIAPRPPGAPILVEGFFSAHATPMTLRLWTSRDKWPAEQRVLV